MTKLVTRVRNASKFCNITTTSNLSILQYSGIIRQKSKLTSFFSSSSFSSCLVRICFRTNSGPLNFLPLKGHSHLSFASSCVLAAMNFSISVSQARQLRIDAFTVNYIKLLNKCNVQAIKNTLHYEVAFEYEVACPM